MQLFCNCTLLAIAPRWNECMKIVQFLTFIFTMPGLIASEGKQLVELLRKGNAHHDVGNYEQALEYYNKALKLDSVSGIVHYEIAYTLLAMKRYDKAAEYSRKVILLDSKQQQGAYLMLGSALNMSGNCKKRFRYIKKDWSNSEAFTNCIIIWLWHIMISVIYQSRKKNYIGLCRCVRGM